MKSLGYAVLFVVSISMPALGQQDTSALDAAMGNSEQLATMLGLDAKLNKLRAL